jgi:hypothetical protein
MVTYLATAATLVNVFLTLAPVASVYFKVVNQGCRLKHEQRLKHYLYKMVTYLATAVTLVNVFLTLALVASVHFTVVNSGCSIKHEQRPNTTCTKWLHTSLQLLHS